MIMMSGSSGGRKGEREFGSAWAWLKRSSAGGMLVPASMYFLKQYCTSGESREELISYIRPLKLTTALRVEIRKATTHEVGLAATIFERPDIVASDLVAVGWLLRVGERVVGERRGDLGAREEERGDWSGHAGQ